MKKALTWALVTGFIVFVPAIISRADDASSGEVLKKLNEVTKNQEKILQSLEEVKSELQVVKVRVSSR